MAAYPMTQVSPLSKAVPNAGLTRMLADDDTEHYRRDKASAEFTITIIHASLTTAQFNTLLAFTAANGYGPHTFTFKGRDYTGSLLTEPAEYEVRGQLRNIQTVFLAKRV
jgi:hypothetical protein